MNKKAFALPVLLIYAATIMIGSCGLFEAVRYVSQEAGTQEPRSIKAYYADIAGMRFAHAIILRKPAGAVGYDGLFSTEAHNGETFIFPGGLVEGGTLKTSYNNLLNNLGLGPDSLNITIEEYKDPVSTPWTPDNYRITVAY